MANGPGGFSVGRVSVKVVPDTSKFRQELRAQLEKISEQVKIKVEAELDTKSLLREVQKAAKDASGHKVTFGAELDADGVTKQARAARQAAEKGTGKVGLTAGLDKAKSLARIKADLLVLQKGFRAYRISIPVDWVGLTKGLLIAGALAAVLLSIPNILAGIGGGFHVIAGLMATLASLAAGFVATLTAVIVGMQGMVDALKVSGDPEKFAEALANLAPSAQSAAKALAEFREPLKEIRRAVQENLFTGMDESFSKLKALLPPIGNGLSGVAGGIRGLVQGWIDMATSQQSLEDTRHILSNTTGGLNAMQPALANVGAALRDIALVGSTFFTSMGSSVSDLSQRFADWAAKARKTGEMREWIQNAVDKMRQLGRILGDVVDGLQNITSALKGGDSFLDIIERATSGFERLTGAVENQKALKNFGTVLREVARVAGEVFSELFTSIGRILSDATPFLLEFARSLGGAIVGALRVITPLLRSMFTWLSENKAVMAPILVILTGLVTAFKLLSTVAGGILSVKKSIDSIKASFDILKTVVVGANGGGGLWGFAKKAGGAIASAAKAVGSGVADMVAWYGTAAKESVKQAAISARAWIVQSARAMASAVASFVTMAARSIVEFAKIAAAAALQAGIVIVAWTSRMAPMVATSIAQAVAVGAAWISTWVRMAAAATANAIRMAAAWIIAMGPIGLIIAAVVALVALIIANWDRIKQFTITIWNAIVDFFKHIPGWIGDALSTLWDVVTWPFRKAWEFVTGLWDGAGDFFGMIVGWIRDVLGPLWDVITWPFRKAWDIIKWIIDRIKDAFDAAMDMIDIVTGASVERNISRRGGDVGPLGFTTMSVPLTYEIQEPKRQKLSALNLGPFDASAMQAADAAVMAVDRSSASAQWSVGRAAADPVDIADHVATALADMNLVVEMDGERVARLINRRNQLKGRRG